MLLAHRTPQGGEVYTLDYYRDKARDLESMGADSICIKDMAGLISPYDAFRLIEALKAPVKPPLHLHSHFTSGMASMSHLKAIEAGVDIVDTCMAPYAFRTSHPAVEPLVMTLLGTNRDTGFDIRHLGHINEILEKEILPKYRHLLDDTKVSTIDTNVLPHQIPGGMLSNLVNQLREMNALYPVTARRFLKWKYGHEAPPDHVKPRTLEDVQNEVEWLKKAKAGLLAERPTAKKPPPRGENTRKFRIFVDDEYFEVDVEETADTAVLRPPPSHSIRRSAIPADSRIAASEAPLEEPAPEAAVQGGTDVVAPLPGLIVEYTKEIGDSVNEGETVVILEAMKMQNAITTAVTTCREGRCSV